MKIYEAPGFVIETYRSGIKHPEARLGINIMTNQGLASIYLDRDKARRLAEQLRLFVKEAEK